MKENIMSKETFNILIDGFEYVNNLTDYGRKNIKYHVQKLQQENKQLNEEYTRVQKMYEDTFRDYQKQKEAVDKIYELIKQHIRKDEFLELNEWQTRDLLNLLKEVSDE